MCSTFTYTSHVYTCSNVHVLHVLVHVLTLCIFIGSITLGQSAYGPGIGSVAVTHIGCTGSENNISSCTIDSISTCTHTEDASVICNSKWRGRKKRREIEKQRGRGRKEEREKGREKEREEKGRNIRKINLFEGICKIAKILHLQNFTSYTKATKASK